MDCFDYAVVGSGPAGYVSAIRAAQLGLKTVLIEKDGALGGTCLNVGCIPSKALLESSEHVASMKYKFADHGIDVGDVNFDVTKMVGRKADIVKQLTDGVAGLMKKNKVTVVRGHGRLVESGKVEVENSEGEKQIVEADSIVMALGSESVELPFMKFDGKNIISSTEALALDKVPEKLLVIGAGAIGLELGSVWARLGAEVTVIEMFPQITPFADKQLAKTLQRSLEGQGLKFMLSAKVTGAEIGEDQVVVTVEDKKGEVHELNGDKVLVAVGRRPFTRDCGLETAGVEMTEKGRINVNEKYETNLKGVYAIGDVINGPMLAHKGEEEGVVVAEIVAGKPSSMSYDVIPNIVYTWPELASVGMNEAEAKEKGYAVKSGKFLFRGNGRSLTMGETEGMAKIIADKETDRILGATIVGPRASDMIAEVVMAMEFKGSAEDVARTIHAHPTLSEIIKEAALAVNGSAIHS